MSLPAHAEETCTHVFFDKYKIHYHSYIIFRSLTNLDVEVLPLQINLLSTVSETQLQR